MTDNNFENDVLSKDSLAENPEKDIENEEKLYSREELEKIVKERLKRERKNQDSIRQIRNFIDILRKCGIIKSNSYAGAAKELNSIFNSLLPADSTSSLELDSGIIPETDLQENPKERTDLPDDIIPALQDSSSADELSIPVQYEDTNSSEKPAGIAEDAANTPFAEKGTVPHEEGPYEESLRSDIDEFISAFGSSTLETLVNDKMFAEFAKGRQDSLSDIYCQYINFIKNLAEIQNARVDKNMRSALASTGFSGNSSGKASFEDSLSETQKEIARSCGMSYKEYAELLSQIPSHKVRKSK